MRNIEDMSVKKLFKTYVKGTPEKAHVVEKTVFVCNLTKAVQRAGKFKNRRVHITTKVLKHLYDSKPAEEFEFVLKHLTDVIRFPDHLYDNRESKRGDICFIDTLYGVKYFASIETVIETDANQQEIEVNYVVTCFRLRKESYLNNYRLLWSWEGDTPPS